MNIRFLYIFFLLPLIGLGQHRFQHLDIEDGLTENSITEIFQDKEGYIWFSTQDGISRYDGYNFKSYTTSNNKETSLSDNFLWGFEEDSLGYIWCCSRNGLNRIDKRTGKINRFYKDTTKLLANNQVNDIVFHKGNIIATIGGKVYTVPVKSTYPLENLIEQNIKDTMGIYSFCQHENGAVYTINIYGLSNLSSGELFPIPGFKEYSAYHVYKAIQRDNEFCVTNGKKIFNVNTLTNTIDTLNFNFKGAVINDLLFVKDKLWVATNNGVFIFHQSNLIHRITKNERQKNGLSSNFVSALYTDITGKIWVGTSGNGVCVYDPATDRFKYLSSETFGDAYIVRSMVLDDNNRLLICGDTTFVLQLKEGCFSKNMFASENITSVNRLETDGFEGAKITTFARGFNSDIITGTKGQELFVLDENLKLKKEVSLNDERKEINVVSNIIVTKKKEVWVATHQGVYVLDEEYELKKSYLPFEHGLLSNYFLSVFEDAEENIWLGSNNGIYKYNESNNSFTSYLYKKNNMQNSPGFPLISGFADFSDGYLWVATYGGGLSKMDKKTETFEHFTTENGLINNVCNGIVTDNTGKIWLNTNKGISVFNRSDHSFVNYTKADGLNFNEFNLGSVFKSKCGEIYLGTPVGMIVFNPESVHPSTYVPRVVINGLDINYTEKNERLNGDKIELFPRDEALTIYFAGLNFKHSPKIKYKYKLKGYNENWVYTSDLRASYTSLPDGNYTFIVDVTNDDGAWSNNPKQIQIVVYPPYYKTWWFILIECTLVLVFIILTGRYFVRRKVKKRLREIEIQQKINVEKQRISRDLHDNIGAQITYLISSIDREGYLSEKNQEKFEALSDKARNVMTHLRETIWVINKEAITVSDFVQKIQEYTSKTLSPSEIKYIVSVTGNEELLLPPVIVSNLFRIIQEALNNIVKHAEASSVEVEINVEESKLYVVIQDDGIGMNTLNSSDNHFGIKNMKDRIIEIKGTIEFTKGTNNKGTRIQIHLPVK